MPEHHHQLPIPTVAAAPEEVGIDRAAIHRALERLTELGLDPHVYAIARHGKLVASGAWEPYRTTDEALVYSVSKTFTAAAIGFLVSEGKIQLEDPAWQHIVPTRPPSARLAAITVAQLLAMDTGHSVEQLAQPHMRTPYDPATFFTVEPEHEPGTHFAYNSFASFLLSVIVQQVTGQTLSQYLRPRFFEPLGIGPRYWAPDGEYDQGFSGLHVNVHDLISLGAAYLRWPGADVLPANWSEISRQLHAPNDHQDSLPDNSAGYGFQVWLNQDHGFRADGALGQFCLMIPEQDLVIAYLGATHWPRTQEVLTIWWEEVVEPLVAQAPVSLGSPAVSLGDADPSLPLTLQLESPVTLPPTPIEEPYTAGDITPGLHRFDAERQILQLGEWEFPVSTHWQRFILPDPHSGSEAAAHRVLHVATIGQKITDGGWEGSLVITSSCHRLLWKADRSGSLVELEWHTVPLRGPALAGLTIPKA